MLVKRIVLDIVANLTAPPTRGGTPRDTGWAAANWLAYIGRRPTGAAGSREAVSTAAQQAGIAQIATGYKLAMGKVGVTNNVPYILPLNEGHSQQAPAGFIQIAIIQAVRSAATSGGKSAR